MRGFRQLFLNFTDGADGGGNGASIVVVIEAVEQASVLTHQSHLGSGGTGVDSQVTIAAVCG